jgi:hypothetical protein
VQRREAMGEPCSFRCSELSTCWSSRGCVWLSPPLAAKPFRATSFYICVPRRSLHCEQRSQNRLVAAASSFMPGHPCTQPLTLTNSSVS